MTKNMQKNIVIAILIFSAFLGGFFAGNKKQVLADEYWFSPENTSIKSEDFELFWKALTVLDKKHPNAKDVSSEERVWAAIHGLTESYGDPYTSFFSPEEVESFEEDINGEFSGVGMEVGLENEMITVIAPLKNSPAEKAGLETGDIVVEIDGESTAGMSIDEAVKRIRGPRGETVSLKVAREGEKEYITFSIVRDIIELTLLETKIPEDAQDVFVISIYNFSENIGVKFNQAMKEFVKSGKKKLVLDLRGNPGGYLSSSVDVASVFVPQGKTIVTEAFSEESERANTIYRSKGSDIKLPKNFKMVVLVDGGSASASEIVAGALKEYNVAKLVGTKTFGKGSVQEYLKLDNNTALKVTISKWLTPLGNSISEAGLTPDYEIPYDTETENDNQLEKAIEILD